MLTTPAFDFKTVALVAVIALLIYAYIRHRNNQPSLFDLLNNALSHPEPIHKTPVEHIVEKCVPKPPSPEELRAVVDAHQAGTVPLVPGATFVTAGGTSTGGTIGSNANGPNGGPPAAGVSTPDPLVAALAALSKTPPPAP